MNLSLMRRMIRKRDGAYADCVANHSGTGGVSLISESPPSFCLKPILTLMPTTGVMVNYINITQTCEKPNETK